MGNHTPGPWKVVRSLTCGHLRNENNYAADPYQEWTQADIALIEAAPDLLEFAKQVAEYAQDAECFYLMSLAESVIRKVEVKS